MTTQSQMSLKWSAIVFAVLWTVGMVWWSGSVQPANVVILAICGVMVGYFWYLGMRWFFRRAHLSSVAHGNADHREPPRRGLDAWLVWAVLMVSTGLATAFLRRLADPLFPAGDWHALLSGLFVVVVWPALVWSLRPLLRHRLPG
jgi:hypothetical protein